MFLLNLIKWLRSPTGKASLTNTNDAAQNNLHQLPLRFGAVLLAQTVL